MDLTKSARKALSVLKERQRKILARRFGLLGFKKATLAKIGKDIDRTRERIRQIETAGLKELGRVENQELIDNIQKKISGFVEQLGGVVVEREIVSLVGKGRRVVPEQINGLSLLVTILPGMERTKKNQIFYRYWHRRDYPKKKIEAIASEYEKILDKLDQPVSIDKLLAEFKKTGLGREADFAERSLVSIFSIKRSLGRGKKDQVGLMKWAEINPKSARDKAYLVLKEADKPLHYQEIANKIRKENFYSKHNPTAPTVHNEVILDKRFVLVGRGIYGLKEWGYQSGTVQDVIITLLKKNKSGLSRDKIIKEVSKQRQVARNTILANLNRKGAFKRTGKSSYQLK